MFPVRLVAITIGYRMRHRGRKDISLSLYIYLQKYLYIYTYIHLYIRSHFGSSRFDSQVSFAAILRSSLGGVHCHGAWWCVLLHVSCISWAAQGSGGICLSMPHCRSISSKKARTNRAVELGFAPSVSGPCVQVAVPVGVLGAAQSAIRSLDLHYQHDAALPAQVPPSYHGRLAALHALDHGLVDDQASRLAQDAHRLAGRRKHKIGSKAKSDVARGIVGAFASSAGDRDNVVPLCLSGGVHDVLRWSELVDSDVCEVPDSWESYVDGMPECPHDGILEEEELAVPVLSRQVGIFRYDAELECVVVLLPRPAPPHAVLHEEFSHEESCTHDAAVPPSAEGPVIVSLADLLPTPAFHSDQTYTGYDNVHGNLQHGMDCMYGPFAEAVLPVALCGSISDSSALVGRIQCEHVLAFFGEVNDSAPATVHLKAIDEYGMHGVFGCRGTQVDSGMSEFHEEGSSVACHCCPIGRLISAGLLNPSFLCAATAYFGCGAIVLYAEQCFTDPANSSAGRHAIGSVAFCVLIFTYLDYIRDVCVFGARAVKEAVSLGISAMCTLFLCVILTMFVFARHVHNGGVREAAPESTLNSNLHENTPNEGFEGGTPALDHDSECINSKDGVRKARKKQRPDKCAAHVKELRNLANELGVQISGAQLHSMLEGTFVSASGPVCVSSEDLTRFDVNGVSYSRKELDSVQALKESEVDEVMVQLDRCSCIADKFIEYCTQAFDEACIAGQVTFSSSAAPGGCSVAAAPTGVDLWNVWATDIEACMGSGDDPIDYVSAEAGPCILKVIAYFEALIACTGKEDPLRNCIFVLENIGHLQQQDQLSCIRAAAEIFTDLYQQIPEPLGLKVTTGGDMKYEETSETDGKMM